MRKLLAIAFLLSLLVPISSEAGYVFVQSARDATCGGCPNDALTLNNVNPGALLVFANINSNAQTVSGVADSETTTTWAQCTELAGAVTGYRHKIWWAIAKLGGTHTVTMTFSASTAESASVMEEWLGNRNTTVCDKIDGQEQTNPGTGTDAITSTAQTTTVAGSLIIGSTAESSGTGVVSAGTGFTCRVMYFNVGACDGTQDSLVYDQIQAAAGSIATTATTTDATALYTTIMATFLPGRSNNQTVLGVGN